MFPVVGILVFGPKADFFLSSYSHYQKKSKFGDHSHRFGVKKQPHFGDRTELT